MQAGDLNKKINILVKNSNAKDADGYSIEQWDIFKSAVWTNVRDLSGRSFYQLDSEQQVKTITCTIRYRKDINESMRVVFRNETFRIIRIYQGEYEDNFICLDCQLIKGVSD